MKRIRRHDRLDSYYGRSRFVGLRGNKLLVDFVNRMTHGAYLCELRVNQLKRRQQPITRQSHDTKVRENVGKIASPCCQQQDRHDQTAESERLYEIASAVGKNRKPRVHLRENC